EFFTVRQAACAACLLTLVFVLFVNVRQFGYRYLLPLNGFFVLVLALEIDERLDGRRRRLVLSGLAAIVLLSVGALCELGRIPTILPVEAYQKPATGDERALKAVLERLQRAKIRHVYT